MEQVKNGRVYRFYITIVQMTVSAINCLLRIKKILLIAVLLFCGSRAWAVALDKASDTRLISLLKDKVSQQTENKIIYMYVLKTTPLKKNISQGWGILLLTDTHQEGKTLENCGDECWVKAFKFTFTESEQFYKVLELSLVDFTEAMAHEDVVSQDLNVSLDRSKPALAVEDVLKFKGCSKEFPFLGFILSHDKVNDIHARYKKKEVTVYHVRDLVFIPVDTACNGTQHVELRYAFTDPIRKSSQEIQGNAFVYTPRDYWFPYKFNDSFIPHITYFLYNDLKDLTLLSTGQETKEDKNKRYTEVTFTSDTPVQDLYFLIGNYNVKEYMGKDYRLDIAMYPNLSTFSDTIAQKANTILPESISYFGPLPKNTVYIASVPESFFSHTDAAYTDDNLVAVKDIFLRNPSVGSLTLNDILAHEFAHLWTRDICPVSMEDTNLFGLFCEGEAEYGHLLYARTQNYEKEVLLQWLNRFNEEHKNQKDVSVNYQEQGYSKGGYMFYMLEQLLGAETLQTALRAYHEQRKFMEGMDDFISFIGFSYSMSASDILRDFVYSSDFADIEVQKISVEKEKEGYTIHGLLVQSGMPLEYPIPMKVVTKGSLGNSSGEENFFVKRKRSPSPFSLYVRDMPVSLYVDPDWHILKKHPHLVYPLVPRELYYKETEEKKPQTKEEELVDSAKEYDNKKGDYTKAKSLCEEAMKINPKYARAYNCLAVVQGKFKNYEDAVKWAEQAVALDSSDVVYQLNLGNFLGYAGNKIKALVEADKALRIDPTYTDTYLVLGGIYNDLKLYEQAIALCKSGLQINPQESAFHWLMQMAYFNAVRHKESVVEGLLCIKEWPDNRLSYHMLAFSYKNLGEKSKALGYAKKYLSLNPPEGKEKEDIVQLVKELEKENH